MLKGEPKAVSGRFPGRWRSPSRWAHLQQVNTRAAAQVLSGMTRQKESVCGSFLLLRNPVRVKTAQKRYCRIDEVRKMKKSNSMLEGLTDLLRAGLIALAMFMDMELRSWNNYSNWFTSFQPYTFGVSAAAALAFIALRWGRKRLPAPSCRMRIAALFLGAWQVAAVSVVHTVNINQPFLTSGQVMKAVVMALGMACLFTLLFRLLEAGLDGRLDIGAAGESRVFRLYRSHTLAFCAAVVLLCWLPQMTISYPGTMNSDTENQFRQAMDWQVWDANHPTFGTALIALAVRLGWAVGNGNIGIFAYIFVQALLAALVIGYSQQLMRQMRAPRWLRLSALGICAFMPVYCDNITVILKDVPYSYAMLLLLCETVRCYFLEDAAYMKTPGFVVRMAVAGVFLLKIRNNGLLIWVPVGVALILWTAKMHRRMTGFVAAAVLIPILLGMGFDGIMRNCVESVSASPREAMSLPIQQTARFVAEYGDEVTPEERAIIDKVIDYDALVYKYDPMISDPIKSTYREDASAQDVVRYLGVWSKLFLRHPGCCLAATLVQNTLLFDPQTYNLAIFSGTGLSEQEEQALGVFRGEKLGRLDQWEDRFHQLLFGFPFVMQLNTLGFYCIVLLGACAIAGSRKLRGVGKLLMPQTITMVSLLFGPCIQNQDRYGFPVIYLMPLALACLAYAMNRQKTAE